ncbi:c-di-GMP-binding flagellar brake protein YcgR [Cytobacillus eiseniae]|uniref:C-di-GMP-binding flagellar brake protein YcgR n=1 Tax=Cytobacillus eiseniae TaxID=762947 RepID=A0ABS4RCS5_9BACI|nr:flagellar brake domain-containing protein [Cytobacillus eiseniae]MBP2240700.1 c-di-GMP-binding flagellar brake protein YcgR [Cytobacillus eiseniae]
MINIGDILILEPSDSEKDEKYKCKIVEKTNNKIYIDYPKNMETNRTVFLLDGTQLKGNFVTEDDTVYLFECEVLSRVKHNIPMIVLSYPGEEHLMRIQRRQYVRVETPVDVAVHSMNAEFPPMITITDDISAGGAAIISPKNCPLKPSMEINNWFVLPMQNGETHYLKLKSKVVRLLEKKDANPIISVQFVDISPKDRQLLLRFCFDRQLAYRKKGLD